MDNRGPRKQSDLESRVLEKCSLQQVRVVGKSLQNPEQEMKSTLKETWFG